MAKRRNGRQWGHADMVGLDFVRSYVSHIGHCDRTMNYFDRPLPSLRSVLADVKSIIKLEGWKIPADKVSHAVSRWYKVYVWRPE